LMSEYRPAFAVNSAAEPAGDAAFFPHPEELGEAKRLEG
jgi:hypothetical protein